MFRGDLAAAEIAGGYCAYKIEISQNLVSLVGTNVCVRLAEYRTVMLPGSPQVITLNPNYEYLLTRSQRAQPILDKLRARLDREAGEGGISIIMPVYNTPQAWLVEALESVRAQWCSKWELICVNDGSTAPHVAAILSLFAKADDRIRVLTVTDNAGIARATNFGLRAATFDYVAFMDHDDYIEPHAVWSLIRAARNSKADLIYSDEVLTSESIFEIIDVRARPAFSYDYYLSHPYFVHLICVKRDIAYRAQGWDEQMVISADVDFVLRIIEDASTVAHIPSVLYRWRTHGGSAGHNKQQAVTNATMASIQKHLNRLNYNAVASPGTGFNKFHVEWPIPSGKVLIIIPTKNGIKLLKKAIRSIEKNRQSGALSSCYYRSSVRRCCNKAVFRDGF
jgi:glycosyltransferase involved in cell wall biosynthesis